MKKCFLALMFLVSCVSPQSGGVVDILTPDSIGVGRSTGSMNALGSADKFVHNQKEDLEMDIEGTTESTSVYLTWDFPEFTDNRALSRETRRDNYVASINQSVTNLEELSVYQLERDVEISKSHEDLVDSFLLDSDRKEQQLHLVSETLEKVNTTLEGLEGLILYNTERLKELENSIPTVQDLIPEVMKAVVIPKAPEVVKIPEPVVVPPKEFAPMINLEEVGRPWWLWALVLVGGIANVYVILRIFRPRAKETAYINTSEVSGSLAWLRKDLLKDET